MSTATLEPIIHLDQLPLGVLRLVESMLADPVRDNAYLSTQLGPAVADYLSWKRNEDGAAEATLDSYERDLSRMCVLLAATPPKDVTADDLRRVRDTFPTGSRYKVTAILKDFWRWAYEEGRADHNPMGRVRYPKRVKPPITDLFTDEEQAAIVSAQTSIRDRGCVLLLLRAGIRKGELRQMRVRDINLADRHVLVYRGKGGKSRRVPVRGSIVRALDLLLIADVPRLGRPLEPTDYVLYPEATINRFGPPDPSRPMGQGATHRWWYGCLQRAGIVDDGVTKGRRMHTTRHTYATDLGRASGWNMLAVQKNLGHSKIGTTVDTYTQFAFEDQEAAVELLPDIGVEF